MNNKGFAITGIIYTLFILFLMILLTVLAGLSSYQRLMVNSTKSLEDSFKGVEISDDVNSDKFVDIKNDKIAYYLGKYIFKLDNGFECSAYLKKDTNFKGYNTARSFSEDIVKLSPSDCNDYDINMDLIKVYSFEVIN